MNIVACPTVTYQFTISLCFTGKHRNSVAEAQNNYDCEIGFGFSNLTYKP